MKKCFILLVIIALTVLMLPIGTFAESEKVFLLDNGNFLDSQQEKEVTDLMEDISLSYDIDVIILLDRNLFSEDLSSSELYDYMLRHCRNVFDSYSETGNGIMLLISLDGQYRDYYFLSKGDCEKKINTDRSLDYIEDNTKPYIQSNDFFNAAIVYLNSAGARMSVPDPTVMDYVLEYLPVVFIVSFIIALIAVFIMKGQLSSVKPKANASDYSVRDSFRLKLSRDIFLYKTVTKTPRPKDTRSGGAGGGGGGGGGRGGRC